MRTKRAEFSESTKATAYEREGGRCQECGKPTYRGAEYDHRIPCALGGTNELENCVVLCAPCHKRKTREHDRPAIDKSKRIAEKRMGLRAKSRGFDTRYRKKMDGTVVPRS